MSTIEETSTEPVRFPEETLKKVQEIIGRYPEGRQKSAILPILHLAQNEWNWLSAPVMDYVASLLSIQPIEVYEVATFYTMFNLEPVGKYVLEVCRTGPCCLRGAEELIEYIQNKFGIEVGQTSPDGRITLKTVECLAACGGAPLFAGTPQAGRLAFTNTTKTSPRKIDEVGRPGVGLKRIVFRKSKRDGHMLDCRLWV
jgi:NADH-quinone oxidoreductase subunit E